MHRNDAFPTLFGVKLAETAGVMLKDEKGVDHWKRTEQATQLAHFQQMSITCPFDECLIAFHGTELNSDQVTALRLIYKSTKPWLLGHTVGILIDKLDDPKLANRDFAEALKTIIEQITKTDDPETKQAAKGMLVKLATMDKK